MRLRRPTCPRPRIALASLLAVALGSPLFGPGAPAVGAASSVATTEGDVALAADALAAATAARVRAERRHAELAGELAAVNEELEVSFAGAAELAAELESARNHMRRSAISAFISGGPEDLSIELLSGADLAEVSGRRTFAAEQTLDWADAESRFEALKADNDPQLVALAERREALASKVADAVDAVFQANAVEADAERESAEAARRRDEAAAAAAQAAAAADAERQAAARPAPSPAPAASIGAPSTPTSPAPRSQPPSSSIVVLTELSAPLPELPPGGPSEEAWAEVRRCESSGNYRAVSRSGRYRGAYQFDQQTWESMGGRGDPAGALPIEQDARAKALYAQRGARAWPHCGLALV